MACKKWECLPFRSLSELNDPNPQGCLFIGFPVFTIFSHLNGLPVKGGFHLVHKTFWFVHPNVRGHRWKQSVRMKCLPHVFIHWTSPMDEPSNTKASQIPQLPRLPLRSLHTLASEEHYKPSGMLALFKGVFVMR